MNGHDRDMATAEDCNPSLAFVLEKGQFLGKGIDLVEGRKIKGAAQRHPASSSLKLAAISQPSQGVADAHTVAINALKSKQTLELTMLLH